MGFSKAFESEEQEVATCQRCNLIKKILGICCNKIVIKDRNKLKIKDEAEASFNNIRLGDSVIQWMKSRARNGARKTQGSTHIMHFPCVLALHCHFKRGY